MGKRKIIKSIAKIAKCTIAPHIVTTYEACKAIKNKVKKSKLEKKYNYTETKAVSKNEVPRDIRKKARKKGC